MVSATEKDAATADQRDALRQRLLKLIVRNEAQRRDRRKASDK